MGFLDRLVTALGLRKKEANVLVVGLDNSGTRHMDLGFTNVLTVAQMTLHVESSVV
jgi:hypothetical protein